MKFSTAFRLLARMPVFAALSLFTMAACAQDLPRQFHSPSDTTQTSVYWYWLSDNISKEGVIKDLQAMKKAGINRAFIGNIGLDDVPYGKAALFSDQWWDILHTALRTATDLHIDIGLFNGPGWSQSGGPWIKPGQAMRYLRSTEQLVTGPGDLHIKLNRPAGDFQDTRVIAFPAPDSYKKDLGGVWTPPYRIDISPAIHRGVNTLEVEVVNTWTNRLIGDARLPQEQRKTWTIHNPFKADSHYQSSGLLGPVKLETIAY